MSREISLSELIEEKKKNLSSTLDVLKTHLANAGQEFDRLEIDLESELENIDDKATDLTSDLETMQGERDEAVEALEENASDLSSLHDAIAELAALAYPGHPTRVEYIIRRLAADDGPDLSGYLPCLRIGHQVAVQQAMLELVAHVKTS